MTIVDDALLEQIRQQWLCELCGHRRKVEPHHVWSRGAGRLDVSGNILALCRPCHQLAHQGLIRRVALQLLVAHRERLSLEELEKHIFELRRRPK